MPIQGTIVITEDVWNVSVLVIKTKNEQTLAIPIPIACCSHLVNLKLID